VFTRTRQRFGTFDGGRPRVSARRVAGLAAVVAAGFVAVALASAAPPPTGATMYTHSATTGEVRGGRLVLHGVTGRVTWVHIRGRSGVMAIRRLHRELFSPATSVTGTLHVAGHHGGDEPTFRLSNPRYNPARHTVSYAAKRLDKKRVPGGAARSARAATSFGAASLSMVADSSGVADCAATVVNNSGYNLKLFESPIKDGAGVWDPEFPTDPIPNGGSATWGDGAEPCQNTVALVIDSTSQDWFRFRVINKWYAFYKSTCSQVTGPDPGTLVTTATGFSCTETTDAGGKAVWTIQPG
jgi:hypothetical protein